MVKTFVVGNGQEVRSVEVGTFFGETEEGVKFKLEEVYVVPKFAYNIISLNKFLQRGCHLRSEQGRLLLGHKMMNKELAFRRGKELGLGSSLFFLKHVMEKPEELHIIEEMGEEQATTDTKQ